MLRGDESRFIEARIVEFCMSRGTFLSQLKVCVNLKRTLKINLSQKHLKYVTSQITNKHGFSFPYIIYLFSSEYFNKISVRHIGAFTLTSLQQSVLIVLCSIFFFIFRWLLYTITRDPDPELYYVYVVCVVGGMAYISYLYETLCWVYKRKIVAIRTSSTYKHKNVHGL